MVWPDIGLEPSQRKDGPSVELGDSQDRAPAVMHHMGRAFSSMFRDSVEKGRKVPRGLSDYMAPWFRNLRRRVLGGQGHRVSSVAHQRVGR